MSFQRPDLATLIARVRDDADGALPGVESRLRRSMIDILLRTHTGAVDGLYGFLDAIAQEMIWDRADGEYLERWAGIWGVQRKPATVATGTVALTGLDEAIVPDQAVLGRPDGATFLVAGPVSISGSTATATVTAAAAGEGGNTEAGVALAFASPASGIGATATVATGGLTGGGDEELDAALLARLLDRIQQPPAGGNADDYLKWALAQTEVTRAWVYPGWQGPGTVGLTFVMDGRTDMIPTDDDVAAMAAAIDPLRPVTATVVVFAPTPIAVPFTLSVTPVGARAAVAASLADLFDREGEPGTVMLISHMREAISIAAGVYDYTLTTPNANFAPDPGHIPILGAITWAA